jgi:hypothetical protein
MCAVVVLALILLPALGAGIGYWLHGASGAWFGGFLGLVAALVAGGGPVALLLDASRKRLARERAAHPEDWTD